MHIGIFHERFVFRFGVDRVLLCLAKEFRACGHRVTLIGQKFDEHWSQETNDRTIVLPIFDNYVESDLCSARWLQENWDRIFPSESTLDVAVVGGWPFFQTMALLHEKGIPVWYQDHGIAPEEGFPEGHKRTISLLRNLKSDFLKYANGVFPVSDFIARSQTYPALSSGQPVIVIPNGCDHVTSIRKDSLELVSEQPKKQMEVFSIGRFESGTYKQSQQIFDIARLLKQRGINFSISVLASEDTFVPSDLEDVICLTGFLSDENLFQKVANSDVCVCFSKWEGFNLGLAESQSLLTPCLVYNCCAHPEVVASNWLLCNSLEDFADKIEALYRKRAPTEIANRDIFLNYSQTKTWNYSAQRMLHVFSSSKGKTHISRDSFSRDKTLIVEVGNASRDPANSGVVRVTRQLSARLSENYFVVFVCWDEKLQELRFPTDHEIERLATYGGPVANVWQPISQSLDDPAVVWDFFGTSEPLSGWLILPEIKSPEAINYLCQQAKRWSLNTAAVFYDAIAVIRPDLVQDERYREPHLQYMLAIADCDVVIPISRASENDLLAIWAKHGRTGNARTILLPGGFQGNRPISIQSDVRKNIALCVSTIEPRKNHRNLIKAFSQFKSQQPAANINLVLVGNRYAGAEDLAQFIEESVASSSGAIQWKGIVSDEELKNLYSESRFTVYPSEIEGFGLPILESVWYGVPCLCHNRGVMAELAEEGGCLTVDATNPNDLAAALERLTVDHNFCKKLSDEAISRPIKSWDNYSHEFIGTLCLARNIDICFLGGSSKIQSVELSACKADDWKQMLFGDSIHNGWQMSDSEKTGLLAILQRHRPKISIEIGTYKGGSLSLIRQYSDRVFSLDVDPNVAEHFAWMENVSFLTGDSKLMLPLLLSELEACGATPEFILIDGDHSTDGVKSDLESVLKIKPRRTCFVILHDMANKICRNGALAIDWQRYLYVQHVDLDFIPGRLVENGSKFDGQVWGGLGIVVLGPSARQIPLVSIFSCQRTLSELWKAERK